MSDTPLRSAHVSASGTVINHPTRIRFLHLYAGATGGDVVVSVDTGQATAQNHLFTVLTSSVQLIDLTASLGFTVRASVAITLPSTCKATLLYG